MQRYYTPRKYSKYTLGSVTQQQLVSLQKQPVLEVGLKARRDGGGGGTRWGRNLGVCTKYKSAMYKAKKTKKKNEKREFLRRLAELAKRLWSSGVCSLA